MKSSRSRPATAEESVPKTSSKKFRVGFRSPLERCFPPVLLPGAWSQRRSSSQQSKGRGRGRASKTRRTQPGRARRLAPSRPQRARDPLFFDTDSSSPAAQLPIIKVARSLMKSRPRPAGQHQRVCVCRKRLVGTRLRHVIASSS